MSKFAPASIAGLIATVNSINSITINWTNGENSGCVIERTVPLASADASPTNYQVLALVTAGVTTYADTTVQAGSFYSYRVTSLPESDALMSIPDKGVIVSATTSGVQPHLDSSRPPSTTVSYAIPVILNGTSSNSWTNAAPDFNPPVVDPSVNGLPYNF